MVSSKEKYFWVFAAMAVAVVAFFIKFISLKFMAIFLVSILGSAIFFVPLKWSFLIFYSYVCFEGFAKVATGYNPVVHVGVDLLSGVFLIKVFIDALLRKITFPKSLPPLSLLFIAHFFWYLITILNPYSIGLLPSLAASKLYVTMVVLFFFGYYIVKEEKDFRLLIYPWVIGTSIHVGFALYQSANGPDSMVALHPGYQAIMERLQYAWFRPFGLTNLPGAPAIFVALSFPALLYLLARTRYFAVKLLLGTCIPFWIIVLLLCQIRSAIAATIIGAALFIFFNLKYRPKVFHAPMSWKKKIAIGVITLAGSFVGVPKLMNYYETTFGENAMAFQRSLSLFEYSKVKDARSGALERFVKYATIAPLGAGLSRIGPGATKFSHLLKKDRYFSKFFTDNLYLALLIDLGIPGMCIMVLIIFGIALMAFRSIVMARHYEYKLMAVLVFSTTVPIIFGGYGSEVPLYNPHAALYFFWGGVGIKALYLSRQKDAMEMQDPQESKVLQVPFGEGFHPPPPEGFRDIG